MTKKLELAASNESTDPADLSVVREDLQTLKTDVVALVEHLKEEGMNETEYLKRRAAHQLEHAQEAGGRGLKELEQKVVARPVQSVAMAFAAGILASLFLGRRR